LFDTLMPPKAANEFKPLAATVVVRAVARSCSSNAVCVSGSAPWLSAQATHRPSGEIEGMPGVWAGAPGGVALMRCVELPSAAAR